MAIKNFIADGYYTRIGGLHFNKAQAVIAFSIEVFEVKDGRHFLTSDFSLTRDQAKHNYLEENPPVFPDAPEYPALCLAREASIPMWTESNTPEEKSEYEQAKADYESAIAQHNIACIEAGTAVQEAAKVNNNYDLYFSDEKLFVSSNVTACAYSYLKSLPEFAGCEDA